MSAKLLFAGIAASALIAGPVAVCAQSMPSAPIPYTELNAKTMHHRHHRAAEASDQGNSDVAKAAGDEKAAVASDQSNASDASAEDSAAGAKKERKLAHKYAKKAVAESKKAQDEKAKADAAEPTPAPSAAPAGQ